MFPEFDLNVLRVSVTVLLFFATSCCWPEVSHSCVYIQEQTRTLFPLPSLHLITVCMFLSVMLSTSSLHVMKFCYINNNVIAMIRTHAARNRSTSNTFNCWKCFTYDSPLTCCEVFWAICVRVRIRHSKDRLKCTSQLLKQNLPWRNRRWC